jgi:hypothetical protein
MKIALLVISLTLICTITANDNDPNANGPATDITPSEAPTGGYNQIKDHKTDDIAEMIDNEIFESVEEEEDNEHHTTATNQDGSDDLDDGEFGDIPDDEDSEESHQEMINHNDDEVKEDEESLNDGNNNGELRRSKRRRICGYFGTRRAQKRITFRTYVPYQVRIQPYAKKICRRTYSRPYGRRYGRRCYMRCYVYPVYKYKWKYYKRRVSKRATVYLPSRIRTCRYVRPRYNRCLAKTAEETQ